jgi:predicted polyphosphate/ATP-dependent NAD kinase
VSAISTRKRPAHGSLVGILANPASGRDIRRLVAHGTVFPLAEKCSIIVRLLSALGATGVEQVLLVPDRAGIAERLRRIVATQSAREPWPEVGFLDMPVEDGPMDTVRAVEQMRAAGAGAIVVLGGDGTQRLAASACGGVPLMALSTGTNNVFPELREPTIAGMATGLIATGQVPAAEATVRNKVLRLEIDGVHHDLAVVDISVSDHRWVGSKALWRPDTLDQIFVAFAEPDAIGLSSVAGLLRPVSRRAAFGLRVDLALPERAALTLTCPIAPGLMMPVGIEGSEQIQVGEVQHLRLAQGVIALDGEREWTFTSDQKITIRLDDKGPFTIDVDSVMGRAARDGLLVVNSPVAEATGGKSWN